MSDQPLFDLGGMSERDAKEYIASLSAHYHQLSAELEQISLDLEVWHRRVQTAESAGKAELADQARARINQLLESQVKIQTEAQDFRLGLDKLKSDLKLLPLTQRTIDPELLLDALEKVAGPTDQITPLARKREAEEALAALKERLKGENKN
ncbi:MAG: hypothetical protein HKM05_03430 [Spirochaetales bacterium]|nr:hypothetical protein [Spirochaetales bacterium]